MFDRIAQIAYAARFFRLLQIALVFAFLFFIGAFMLGASLQALTQN